MSKLGDWFKDLLNTSDADYDDENLEEETQEIEEEAPKRKKRTAPRSQSRADEEIPKKKAAQVVIKRPEGYGDAKAIAEEIMQDKVILLNLELVDRENARRIIDFLSGVTYARHGILTSSAEKSFVITPYGVSVMGEDPYSDFESNINYF